MVNSRKNINWIDYTKTFAIFMVVTTHLYMSFAKSGWVSKDALFYNIPIQMSLVFTVQLFFVCSGFLYQYFRKDTSVKGHFKNIVNKAIALGVPYFVFSGISLAIKNVFSASVNSKPSSILHTLFIKPMAPYWYLYVLFLLFVIIPCVNDKKKIYIIFVLSVAAKFIYVFFPIKLPYILMQIVSQSIWFTFGMLLTTIEFKYNYLEKFLCLILGGVGIILSIFFFRVGNGTRIIRFSLSILLVLSLLYCFMWISRGSSGRLTSGLRKYILPIFLMHTIFAAGMRILLTKAGISLFSVHIVLGTVASFVFPVLVYIFIQNKWYLLVFIEPLKAWKMKKSSK